MSDELDDGYEDESLEDLRNEIRTHGARDAVNALRAVCRDPKATAQAKATAGSTLLRAAGLLDKVDDPASKEVHQMTADELQREIERHRQRKAEAAVEAPAGISASGVVADDVFG